MALMATFKQKNAKNLVYILYYTLYSYILLSNISFLNFLSEHFQHVGLLKSQHTIPQLPWSNDTQSTNTHVK